MREERRKVNAPTARSLFVIDPWKKIRLTMTYPVECGRNAKEVLRVVHALKQGDEEGEETKKKKGEDVIDPSFFLEPPFSHWVYVAWDTFLFVAWNLHFKWKLERSRDEGEERDREHAERLKRIYAGPRH